MADTVSCAEFDEASAELALELMPGPDRDRLLAHAATCARCRGELAELSTAADLMVLLAPEAEPPIGFEQRAFDRIPVVHEVPARRRTGIWLGIAAAIVLFAVGLAVGLTRSSKAPGSAYRSEALIAADGESFGAVSLAVSDGVVLTMSLEHLGAGDYGCVLERTDGSLEHLATWPIGDDGSGIWAVPLDVADVDEVRAVLLEADDGTRLAVADFSR